MSLSSLISDIKTNVFGSSSNFNKQTKLAKITPIFDTEYTPDIEEGEGDFYKRLNERQLALNCDLEKADKTIICKEVSSEINVFKKYKFIETCVLFMDIVNNFTTQNDERDIQNLPYTIDDVINPISESQRHSNINIEIIDNDLI